MTTGYRRYSQAYQKTAVSTMDQRKLIVMLYDGAIKFLSQAGLKLKEKDNYAAHTSLVRGKSIIAELLASLNMESGGDIAVNLQRIYAYIFNQLIEANVNKDPEIVEHVVGLLKELRSAWKEIPSQPGGNQKPAAPAAVAVPATQNQRNIEPGTPPGKKRVHIKG